MKDKKNKDIFKKVLDHIGKYKIFLFLSIVLAQSLWYLLCIYRF